MHKFYESVIYLTLIFIGGLVTVAKKSEVQDLLDSILKIAYPYISQARKMTDMNKMLEYFRSGPGLKFRLLPEALPEGYKDKTQVILGFQLNKEGIKSIVKTNVWKEGTHVLYEHEGAWFFKPIISGAEPIEMEDAKSGFSISATGRAREVRSTCCGDFTLTTELHNDRPVYRNSQGRHLYSTESGARAVDWSKGGSQPKIRSTSAARSPTLCQQWNYRDYDGDKYKPGDITVTWNK